MKDQQEKINLNKLGIFYSEQLEVNSLSFWWQKKYKEIQNNDKITHKQEWLIEINNLRDELEKYDKHSLKKFLPQKKSNQYSNYFSNNRQERNEGKNTENIKKFSDYYKFQEEIYKNTLRNSPFYCSYCGCTGKDVWSEPWIKKDGVYDFSEFKKKCPICSGKSHSQNKSDKSFLKLIS